MKPAAFLAVFGALVVVLAAIPASARDFYGYEDVALQTANFTTCKAILVKPYNASNLRTPVNGTCRGDGVLNNGNCYPGCPGNSTVWTWSVDTTAATVTCTLVACADGTTMCGSYCMKTADATALSGAGMCATTTSVLDAYGGCNYCAKAGKGPGGRDGKAPGGKGGRGRMML